MLLTLDALAREDGRRLRRLVGGKAASLVRLHAMGVPVPPALVLPVEAMQAHLAAHGLAAAAQAGEDLSARLLATRLDPALAGALRHQAALLGPLLAVRSSAVDEDARDASFAGQYHTSLGVLPGDGVEAAVLRCWASAATARVQRYRRARGRGAAPVGMAVVIQRQLQPRCAGVLFTVDPSTGSWREMTVEAAWGQGEAVVAGWVVPEFHRVRRPRRSPPAVQRLAARVRLTPTERVPSRQPGQWQVDPTRGGLVAVPVPPARLDAAKLDRDSLLALCRLGLRVEARLGTPVDAEWAQDEDGALWLLQARPVTASAPVREAAPTVWTRRFVGERWTVPATPLGWSLVREVLEWFIAYPQTSRRYLGGAPPTRLHRCAPYFNVSLFRHLAFKLPGMPPPRFMVELLPPGEEARWLRRRGHPPDLRVYASIFRETARERRWQRFRWNLFTNWRAWEELVPRLDAAMAELAAPIDRRAEALARARTCEALAREYVKVHICSLLFANIWYQLAEGALSQAGQGELAADLLQPPTDSPTARMNRALWQVGRGQRALDDFLAEYGARADGSWELFAPRWCEEPDRVQQLARAVAEGPDPELSAARARARTAAALPRVAPRAAPVVRLARRYLALREEQRLAFDRLAWQWRRAWTWLEAESNLELRFLEAAEARALLDGALPRPRAEELIARRAAAWRQEVARRAAGDEPPVFLVGEEAPEEEEGAAGQRLHGLGISAGVVTGPARVVRSLADAHRLQPGDILVTRATDPAWTPLFLNARGVVMELGGMLSHGAVVAREYGLPAVVNVSGATRLLADGQTITVDGRRGLVWIR